MPPPPVLDRHRNIDLSILASRLGSAGARYSQDRAGYFYGLALSLLLRRRCQALFLRLGSPLRLLSVLSPRHPLGPEARLCRLLPMWRYPRSSPSSLRLCPWHPSCLPASLRLAGSPPPPHEVARFSASPAHSPRSTRFTLSRHVYVGQPLLLLSAAVLVRSICYVRAKSAAFFLYDHDHPLRRIQIAHQIRPVSTRPVRPRLFPSRRTLPNLLPFRRLPPHGVRILCPPLHDSGCSRLGSVLGLGYRPPGANRGPLLHWNRSAGHDSCHTVDDRGLAS